ncbi:ubiquitin-associated protein 1 [Zophobas morio]|uniref:ubiquitin-associated protein 1 n=1 Tax=Zophobas morio TaxID=2755281 RepID=UPI003082F6E1
MANKQVQETSGGYMDNVRVKISEKYKPPPKIGLPMSYAQRLTLNKQIQDTIPNYEFVLEKTVVEKMKEWRNARSVMFQQLSVRLEKAKVEEKKKREEKIEYQQGEKEEESSPTNNLYLGPSQSYQQKQPILVPTQATPNLFSSILTPIPLKDQIFAQNIEYKSPEKSPFNISDFEADTSSPFDNMELKSINDLEELAQVLKGDQDPKLPLNYSTSQSSTSLSYPAVGPSNYSYTIPNTTSYMQPVSSLYTNTNGYYYPPETIAKSTAYNSPYPYSNQIENRNYSCSPGQESKMSTYKNIPDIMKTLQNELNNTHLDNTRSIVEPRQSKDADVFPKVKTKSEDLCDEFNSLPKNMQDMSKAISSMGFPLSRVARVCKIVGNDQKKVVEHLLAMSDLLDLGFSESRVSTALLQCDNDRDKALDILIS